MDINFHMRFIIHSMNLRQIVKRQLFMMTQKFGDRIIGFRLGHERWNVLCQAVNIGILKRIFADVFAYRFHVSIKKRLVRRRLLLFLFFRFFLFGFGCLGTGYSRV
ncbi:hypothetical protein KBTX_04471 [wastewater metagenome]|uniref:Uncharacterized protein n=2 Tax=unclassified sequences TaxID=12908 RepID=A0A5B8RJ95_9ZZZZ|nr:hypothetical protein KBTEX_04471 [uncultured organism]